MNKIFTKFNLYFIAITLLSLTACKKHYNNDDAPSSDHVPAIWTKISSLPATEKFSVMETSGNSVYAISKSNNLYISSDLGLTWSSSPIKPSLPGIEFTALAIFENKIYAATNDNGIFVSPDNGKTWSVQVSMRLNTSFAIWNNNLYVSSAEGVSPAGGILVLNKQSGTWEPFNSAGLPGNYDVDVNKIIVANQTLAAIRGGNGNFYGYGNASGQWNQKSYFTQYRNVRMQDIVYDKGIMLVSSGFHVLYSNDFANNWAYDTIGLKKITMVTLAKTRVLYAANQKLFVLSNMPAGGTWIQQRDQSAPAGTTWASAEEFLPNTGASYDIRLLDNVFFIVTDNGIYYKKGS